MNEKQHQPRLMAELPRAPGICDDCHAEQAALHASGLVIVYCHHTQTGAITNLGGPRIWSSYGPIECEEFAGMLARILDGRGQAQAAH